MRRPTGDGGQMMAALVIALAVTLLAFVVIAVVPIGAATNEKTRSQTAADAAALAGAEALRTRWVDEDTAPNVGLGVQFYPGRGRSFRGPADDARSQAESYARQNGARITGYSLVRGRGEVRVEVENDYAAYPERGRATSRATADMDINFSRCRWSDERPPGFLTIEEAAAVGATTDPTFTVTLTCGDWEVEYEVVNSSVALFKITGYPPGRALGLYKKDLRDALEPRLVD